MGQGLHQGDQGRPEPGGHSGRGERGSLPGRAGRMCSGVGPKAAIYGGGKSGERLVLTWRSSGQATRSTVEGDRVSE